MNTESEAREAPLPELGTTLVRSSVHRPPHRVAIDRNLHAAELCHARRWRPHALQNLQARRLGVRSTRKGCGTTGVAVMR